MRVWIAVIGVVKEAKEPVGVFTSREAAETCARRFCDSEWQAWEVWEFDLDGVRVTPQDRKGT